MKAMLCPISSLLSLSFILGISACNVSRASDVGSSDRSLSENIVARTILAEARGSGFAGMYGVACVIQERSIERKLPPAVVCLEGRQFSCWNKATSRDRQFKPILDNQTGKRAKELAALVVRGATLDRSMVGFANCYCAIGLDPSWSVGMNVAAEFGGHKFFKR
jgi:spore germination cell wall hydrolase CwlJ-like protein